MCARAFVCKIFGPDEPGRFTHPVLGVGRHPPSYLKRVGPDWGRLDPEIDEVGSDLLGVDRAKKPYTYTLFFFRRDKRTRGPLGGLAP